MAKPNLIKMLETASLQDLQSLLKAKEKLEKLNQRRSSLEKDLASVDKEIISIEKSFGKSTIKSGPRKSIKKKASGRVKKTRKKIMKKSQPSIQSLIIEILEEKKKPLSVNEIADSLLKEKKYKTKSANFKNQLRVLLYRNDRGLFKKVGSGQFDLADGKASTAQKFPLKKKASSPKIKSTIKKKSLKKPGAKKVIKKKKSAPKKKSLKKSLKKTSPKKKIT